MSGMWKCGAEAGDGQQRRVQSSFKCASHPRLPPRRKRVEQNRRAAALYGRRFRGKGREPFVPLLLLDSERYNVNVLLTWRVIDDTTWHALSWQ